MAGSVTNGGEEAANAIEIMAEMLTAFDPLPAEATPHIYELTEELITLGRMLYYETRISVNQDTSCNSCNPLDRYGVDGLPHSFTPKGTFGKRNAPTIYNSVLHFAQLWDGRAETVEDQALVPITDPEEMAMPDANYAEAVLRAIPGYAPLFAAAFPDDEEPITFENIGMAIGAFERRLITPDRFDDFLNGDESALTDAEKQGLVTFVDVGCYSCHYGPNLGGEFFEKLGLMKPYPTDDPGLAGITGNERDMHLFKVPGLRNVAETAPYFHDGSIATLDEAVWVVGEYQLGMELTDADVADIVTFLASLTGEIPEAYIAVPELPEDNLDRTLLEQ